MDKPWSSMMSLGIIRSMIFPQVMRDEGHVVPTARKIAEDDFFGVLEMTRIKDKATGREVTALLEVSGVEAGFASQPSLLGQRLNLAAPNEAARQAAVADVKQSIDQAHLFGTRILATLDRSKSYPGSGGGSGHPAARQVYEGAVHLR